MNPLYPVVAQRAGHRWEYCRVPEAIFDPGRFTHDHTSPKRQRGGNALATRNK
jgi:hypothetical protein